MELTYTGDGGLGLRGHGPAEALGEARTEAREGAQDGLGVALAGAVGGRGAGHGAILDGRAGEGFLGGRDSCGREWAEACTGMIDPSLRAIPNPHPPKGIRCSEDAPRAVR